MIVNRFPFAKSSCVAEFRDPIETIWKVSLSQYPITPSVMDRFPHTESVAGPRVSVQMEGLRDPERTLRFYHAGLAMRVLADSVFERGWGLGVIERRPKEGTKNERIARLSPSFEFM